jgi:dienelactone hydrolase
MLIMKLVVLFPLLALIAIGAACAGDPGNEAMDDTESREGGEVGDQTEGNDSTESAEDDERGDSHGTDGQAAGSLGTGDGTFTVRTETFVDETRPTSPEVPQRTLVTDIYVPGGKGPFPLVMHAHGMDGTSGKFSQLLGHWAEAGYVVVAPNFPRTNGDAPEELRDLADYLNQPGDVTFTLDRVLEMNEPGGELAGVIATDHMGISGLSLGGATTYPLLFNSCCRDERYLSGILMSALELPFEGHTYDYSRRIPILAFAGTDDSSIPYELQQEILGRLGGPKWNVTLPGGQHSQPFENNPSPQDELVFTSTVDFWELTLRDDAAAEERLVTDATVEGLSFVDVTP